MNQSGSYGQANRVTVFAPATCANVAVGFDLMGFPLEGVGDRVTVTRVHPQKGSAPVVTITSLTGIGAEDLPRDAAANTATVGLIQMVTDLKLAYGFEVKIQKGIPLGSGMGGSAASSVAAVVAANELLESPLARNGLIAYMLMGEKLATGSAHPDNVVPCFQGGLSLTLSINPIQIIEVPVPSAIRCVLVHPHFRLDTAKARAVLAPTVSLQNHVGQSARLAGFLAACYRGDLELLGRSLEDILVEPQRAALIPGFHEVKNAALAFGVLGCSISGSGPSVFAWVDSDSKATAVAGAMQAAFRTHGNLDSDVWISPINPRGAQIEFL